MTNYTATLMVIMFAMPVLIWRQNKKQERTVAKRKHPTAR
jgi:preprotein translocase subunit YajC